MVCNISVSQNGSEIEPFEVGTAVTIRIWPLGSKIFFFLLKITKILTKFLLFLKVFEVIMSYSLNKNQSQNKLYIMVMHRSYKSPAAF